VNVNQQPEYREVVNQVLNSARGTKQFLKMVKKFQVQDRHDEVLKLAVANPDNTLGVESALWLLNNKQQKLIRSELKNNKDKNIE